MRWAYGVTTVPQRLGGLLGETLDSLEDAGFDKPRLFVDGDKKVGGYANLGLEITFRSPAVKAYGNWVLALWELYVRNPIAERYALFQDDILTYHNLRKYLERCPYPDGGYWNLYTYPVKQRPPPTVDFTGWHESSQMGRGALALVFDRPTVTSLLASGHLVTHPQNSQKGCRSIDGVVVTSLKNLGIKEYIHAPTLVQHIGHESSTLKNQTYRERPETFRGEGFDALDLVEEVSDVLT